MRIERVETFPIALPFRERYRTASGELTERAMVILRIETDSGAFGLGEAVPLSLRGDATVREVAAELDRCGELLHGTELDRAAGGAAEQLREWIEGLLAGFRAIGAGGPVLAALDVGLGDLAGRIRGLPLWRLLGAAESGPIACNATIDAAEPVAAGELAARQLAAGFTSFKVKVGTGPDAARVGAIREAVGENARIRIDANGAWDAGSAERELAELAAHRLELAEQPCPDLGGLASVRARTEIPIVADESVASAGQARAAVGADACDAATLKLAKVGGPLAALEIAELIPSYLSSALDGPIGVAAAVHTAAALPLPPAELRFAHGLATLGMFSDCYAPIEGLLGPVLRPADAPGHGVEIDRSALEELRLR